LKKKPRDDDEPGGSLSSSTPKKKPRNDNEPLGSSSSFALEEKTKK
jgi:hypothetical protein